MEPKDKKEQIKFQDDLNPELSERYPNSLTQEIENEYRKLEIPIKNETERNIQRIDEPKDWTA